MNIQWILFGCILIINAIIALLIAFYVSTKNETTGKPVLILMMIALVIWSFSYAMVTFTRTLEVKLFWLKVENIGISLQPSFWFIYIFLYSFKGKTLSLWQIIPLFIIPAISLYFIFSNNWFYLYYSSVQPISQYEGPLAIERGTWYWVALMHSYGLAIASIAILIWRFIKFGNVIRKQVLLLTAASLIPWGFNLTYQIIGNLFPTVFLPVDFTPISFTVSLGLIGASILRKPLMELVPIARDIVMDHIPEMVFVVDAHDRVLDANIVGTKWLGKSKDELIGRDPLEVFHEWPQVLNRLLYTEETREEIEIPGNPHRTLEVVVTPIYDEQTKELSGRVIVAHDVTDRKNLENDLDQLSKKLAEQAIRDPLTGVFNRRFLAEALDKEIANAQREKNPISIIMMDVDFFKKFNDTYGHKCGDLILKDLASFLVKNSRQGDIVCRYGGEEFVILMPNASLEDAYARAEAWRLEYSTKILNFEGKDLTATFSSGVATFPTHGTEGEAILQVADEALYQSKSNGRNRTTLYKKRNSGEINNAN